MTNQIERTQFHPRVMAWLEQQGYICEHEALVRGTRPDFRAIHSQTGQQLIVECKIPHVRTRISSLMMLIVMQLNSYKQAIKHDPSATVALVIPESEWTEYIVKRCAESKVSLMLIPEDFHAEIKPCPKYTDEYLYWELRQWFAID